MSDPRDPIDDWLGTDVELLPPRSGAFEHVHRAARRRKAMRAASAGAAAVLVVAAGITVPLLASALRPANNAPVTKVGPSGSSSPAARHHHAPRSSPSRVARPGRRGPTLTDASAGLPASGFRPTSVTFVGTRTGAVIGQARSCTNPPSPCTVVAGTVDYGRSWHRVGAPSAGASQIRFLNPLNGWAYGPALYATHDGGATWSQITGLPGRVIDLAAVRNRAFAVVANCTGAGPCGSFTLYSTLATADRWRPVAGGASAASELPGGLQLTGSNGYVLTEGLLLAGPVAAGAWHQVATPARPALLAPAPDGKLFLVCAAPLSSYVSANGGRTWQRLGTVNAAGRATSLAVAPASDLLVLGTTRALYYSADGRSWRQASLQGGPPAGGFTFVGMTTQLLGAAVPAHPGLQEIFTTSDGGLSWQRRPIR